MEGGRSRFINEYQEGDLVLIYGADVANTAKRDRKQLLGILQVEPIPISDTDKISNFGLAEKRRLGKEQSWRFAVPVRRAWQIDQRIDVRHLLPDTYDGTNGQSLASFGQLISEKEAERILNLRVTEVSVFGEPPIEGSKATRIDFATAVRELTGPPPSFGQRTSKRTDGETFAYVFELKADLAIFLGKASHEVRGRKLIKVGFSNDPARRLGELNCGFPAKAATKWLERTRSQPYPDGASAFAVEQDLHRAFRASSLEQGNEFYLCDERLIDSIFAPLVRAFRLKV